MFSPTVSSDTLPAPNTCPLDSPTGTKCATSGTWAGTTCCDECNGVLALSGVFGCFSVNDAQISNLGTSIRMYKDRVNDRTDPPYPSGAAKELKLGERVTFFGCDTVSTKTPIVNVPNRIVKSGI